MSSYQRERVRLLSGRDHKYMGKYERVSAGTVRCRDGVMNDFLSWCMHLLVPFLFHDWTSLHPPSFHRNDFSTCIITVRSS